MHASTSRWRRTFNSVATTTSAKDIYEASRTSPRRRRTRSAPATRGSKVHSTNVFVTINTQQGPTDEAAAIDLIQKMLDFSEDITNTSAGLDSITTWYDDRGPRGGTVVDGTFDDEGLVHSVESEFAVERGGRKNSIHTHIVYRVRHTGWLVFDRLKIKQQCRDALGLRKFPNVQVKLLGNPNESEDIRNYLRKGILRRLIGRRSEPW